MKTPAEIANHPKARLHQQLVATLRASGSVLPHVPNCVALSSSPMDVRKHVPPRQVSDPTPLVPKLCLGTHLSGQLNCTDFPKKTNAGR